MPLFDYQCKKCNLVIEVLEKINETEKPICCEAEMEKLPPLSANMKRDWSRWQRDF